MGQSRDSPGTEGTGGDSPGTEGGQSRDSPRTEGTVPGYTRQSRDKRDSPGPVPGHGHGEVQKIKIIIKTFLKNLARKLLSSKTLEIIIIFFRTF